MIKGIQSFLLIVSFTSSIAYAESATDWYEKGSSFISKAKEKTWIIYKETKQIFEDKNLTVAEKRSLRFEKIWKDIHADLEKGATLQENYLQAPKSAWFSTDQKDIRKNIDEILNDIIQYLSNDDLLTYKDQIASLNKQINEKNKKILTYREDMIGAPTSSKIYTTKDDYKEKIKDTKDEIRILKNKIRIIKRRLSTNLNQIGIKLNEKQIDILLTRVDGDDFVQMNLEMDVINQINKQLLELMKESNEELSQAKKYYAMHLISLELLVKIQQKYIDKLNNVYLKRLDNIIDEANSMISNTKDKIYQENDTKRKKIYEQNLANQQLTLDVAILYKNQMLEQLNKILKAQDIARKNLELANNTYQTVRLSANLYDLMEENQEMFKNVMAIQIPTIEPFENKQIKNRYKELTTLLKKN